MVDEQLGVLIRLNWRKVFFFFSYKYTLLYHHISLHRHASSSKHAFITFYFRFFFCANRHFVSALIFFATIKCCFFLNCLNLREHGISFHMMAINKFDFITWSILLLKLYRVFDLVFFYGCSKVNLILGNKLVK